MAARNCLFCKIAAGEVPAEKVYEDDSVVGFLDIHPVNPGHTMVIPKHHVDEFQEMSEDLYDHVMHVVQQIARNIKEKFMPQRVGLVVHGFGVPHAHIHVIPLERAKDISINQNLEADPDEKALTKAAAILKK